MGAKETKEKAEWREKMENMLNHSLDQYDKLLVYMAGGGLVFSVGFVKDVVRITDDTNTVLLKVSWALLALSLILVLLSYRTAYLSSYKELEEDNDKSDSWDEATKTLNIWSLVLLIAGIVSFIVFVIVNV